MSELDDLEELASPSSPHRFGQRGRIREVPQFCKHGHEFTPENTLIAHRNNGGRKVLRRCRECKLTEQRARRARDPNAK